MLQQLLITIGAGVASAVFFFIPAKGSALALALGVFAPLPLLIVALGYGARSFVIAGLIGAALVAATLSPWLGFVFLAFIALPAAAAANRSLTGGPGAGLAAAAGATIVADWLAIVIAGAGYESFDAAVADLSGRFQPLVTQLFARMESVPGDVSAADFSTLLVYMVAPAMAAWGVFTLAVNLWLAARIVQVSGLLPRPWPDIPASLALPSRAGVALALVLGVALFSSGATRIFAATAASGLVAALAMQGLAVLHFRTRGAPARGGMLVAAYGATVVVFPWPLLVAAFIGLADLFHPLRRGLSVPPPDSQKT